MLRSRLSMHTTARYTLHCCWAGVQGQRGDLSEALADNLNIQAGRLQERPEKAAQRPS
jgi:ATP-dependent protease ClpP protease subunit